jgi:hypothetical protein
LREREHAGFFKSVGLTPFLTYRFNRRLEQRRATILDRLIAAYCTTQTITYRQLVAELSP